MPYTPIENLESFRAQIATLQETPEHATQEGLHLDFKREFGGQKPKKQEESQRDEEAREYARDITQFMNSDGGCLILGVSENSTSDGRMVAGAILGVPKPTEAIKQMEEAFTNYVYPAVSRPHIAQIPIDEQRTILVVNIEPEPSLVAVWNRQRDKQKQGMEFLYRTNHGKCWMTPDEVARRMNDKHRVIRLSLDKLLRESASYDEGKGTPVTLLHHVTLAGALTGVQYWTHEASILGLGPREFTLRLTEAPSKQGEVTIAYDWIVSHWWDRRSGGKVDRPAIQLNAGFSFDGSGHLRITHPSTR